MRGMPVGARRGRLSRRHPRLPRPARRERQGEVERRRSVCGVLLAAPGDIAEIELNCENTNTELPYIDLVNELLEEAVLAPAPAEATELQKKRQTTLSTPELNAGPEYVQEGAYEKLADRVYPWTLPFDLPLAEARAYLGQLNLSRAQLITTFQARAGARARAGGRARARAARPVGARGRNHHRRPPADKAWEYWGLRRTRKRDRATPTIPKRRCRANGSRCSPRRACCSRAPGLEYEELARLLNTVFVNGSREREDRRRTGRHVRRRHDDARRPDARQPRTHPSLRAPAALPRLGSRTTSTARSRPCRAWPNPGSRSSTTCCCASSPACRRRCSATRSRWRAR